MRSSRNSILCSFQVSKVKVFFFEKIAAEHYVLEWQQHRGFVPLGSACSLIQALHSYNQEREAWLLLQLVGDLGIIQMMLVLGECKIQELWDQEGFHLDFSEGLGSQPVGS